MLAEFHYDESWSRSISMDDTRKLEAVRLALRRGDLAEAAKYGHVFELKLSPRIDRSRRP